jgi:hypothetical protein
VDAAETLRNGRRAAGLTQRALARLASVPQPTVARIETGAVMPRVDTLDRLLAACGRELRSLPKPGGGIDRSPIRAMLALEPGERLRLATREARNLDRLLARTFAR